jgi:hypothetical protein
MPSTFSTKLRLELQATGENRTTWGSKANQVFNMIEASVAGVSTIAMGNTNHTLTTANGTADEARNAILICTGANTAVRTLTIPAVSKTYIIRNATTGGFAVTISNGTNSVSLSNGNWSLIWTDGTSIYSTSDLSAVYALLSQVADLSGVTNPAVARTNLGLTIGTNVQGYDPGLAALAAYNTNGMLTQTANDTFVGRQIAGTANQIAITNPDGVAGNPTVALAATVDFNGKTVSNLKVGDTNFTLSDNVDATKLAQFDLSGNTTGTTRTYTLPNATGTLVDLASTQALSNKSITGALAVSGAITAGGGITATGNLTSGAAVVANQNVISSTGALVIGPVGVGGACYLRPNGVASGTGQMTVDSGGNVVVNGTLTVTG